MQGAYYVSDNSNYHGPLAFTRDGNMDGQFTEPFELILHQVGPRPRAHSLKVHITPKSTSNLFRFHLLVCQKKLTRWDDLFQWASKEPQSLKEPQRKWKN